MTALAATLAVVAAAAAPARQTPPLDWPGAEGPLASDVLMPISTAAEELFGRGDAALAAGRPASEVFDLWHDALAAARPGEAVSPRPRAELAAAPSPWLDPDGTADRRSEGVEHALLRRLASLSPELRGAWTARFEGLAREELDGAGTRGQALFEVERRHPGTEAAARAALRLADLALERERLALAALWLERAGGHGALAAGSDGLAELAEALAARGAMLGALEGPAPEPPAWTRASALEPAGFVPLATEIQARPGLSLPRPGQGLQPGACFLDDGALAVQTAGRLVLVDPARLAGGERPSVPSADTSTPGNGLGARAARGGAPFGAGAPVRGEVFPDQLLEGTDWILGRAGAAIGGAPGWPLQPIAVRGGVALVHGRTVERSLNALVVLDLELPADGAPTALLRFALRGEERVRGRGIERSGLELGAVEFQPGMVRQDDVLFCQVRQVVQESSSELMPRAEEELPSWLVAVDLASGEVLWKRFLARGLPHSVGEGPFATRRAAAAAQPLALVGGRVAAGTHLGLVALVEPDGRLLYAFKNRRRAEASAGWSGAAPAADAGGAALLFAPADGDHLYWLRTGPEALELGPLLHAPRAIEEAEVLLGGDADEALVLARSGRERHAAAWRAASGVRHEAPYLGPGERFTGGGLVSESRVLFATQKGVSLLDRERELFLLDYDALRTREGTAEPARQPASAAVQGGLEPGGLMVGQGQRVAVVGPLGVWFFTVR